MILAASALAAAVLAWGWWHAHTHASVHVADNDWWLWWLPLPHVGGTPYANYSFQIFIDSANCVAVSPDP